jgi:tetratricopeptide (TPR) repeat protein
MKNKVDCLKTRMSALLMFALLFDGQRSDADKTPIHTVLLISPEKIVEVEAVLVDTPEGWARGLLPLANLSEATGLFFLYTGEQVRTLSTSKMSFSVDIIFINAKGMVVDIHENAEGDKHHPSRKPVLAALATRGGFCSDHGVGLGHFVLLKGFELEPKRKRGNAEAAVMSVEKRLEENVEKNADDHAALEMLAQFYVANGRAPDAVVLFEKLLKEKKTAARLYGLGTALLATGREEEAAAQLESAIEADPMLIAAYQKWFTARRDESALEELRKRLGNALMDHPEFEEGRLALARLYLATNHLDAAESLLDAAKETPEIVRAKGDVALRRGDFKAAAEAYLHFIQKRPFHPDTKDLRVFVMVHKVKAEQLEHGSGKKGTKP